MSRRLIAFGVVAIGLVFPSTALADFNGFDKDSLKANVQASIQNAQINQSGTATSGPATANGGSATGGAGTGGAGGNVNTGNNDTTQGQAALSDHGQRLVRRHLGCQHQLHRQRRRLDLEQQRDRRRRRCLERRR